MEMVNLSQNGVFVTVPAALSELSLRYRDMLAVDASDKEEAAALWDALADDFEDIGYRHNANRCRRNAENAMRSKQL